MFSINRGRTGPLQQHLPHRSGLGKRGFSLAELLVVLAISSITSTAAYSFYLASIRTYEKQSASVRVQMNVRAALDLLARELRMAGYDPLGIANAGFGPSSHHELSYSADFSEDGTLDPEEQIGLRFYPGEGVLKRKNSATAGNSFQPMFREIGEFEFSYLLADGSLETEPSDPALIRAVQIRVRGKQSSRWEKTTAICRNLRGGTE